MAPPTSERAWPPHSSRKSRWRHKDGETGRARSPAALEAGAEEGGCWCRRLVLGAFGFDVMEAFSLPRPVYRSSCAQSSRTGVGARAAGTMERASTTGSLAETGGVAADAPWSHCRAYEGMTMPESRARQAATSARAQKRSDAKMHQGGKE